MKKRISVLTGVVCLLVPGLAAATNGTFATGNGMKSRGMGGVGAASVEDAFGGANNPGSVALVGNRLDVGLDLFMPSRGMERSGSSGFGTGSLDVSAQSGSPLFLIPEIAYSRQLNDRFSVGLTIYGSGGMNTDYPGGQLDCGGGPGSANPLCGQGRLGVDLQQMIFAPTLAVKTGDFGGFGVSPLLGYQRFQAVGLQAFDNAPGFPPFTSNPGHVTNNGYDSATGTGLRFGYLADLEDKVRVGVAYSTKIDMQKFSKYSGLIANGGDLDVPANVTAGIAIRPIEGLTAEIDYSLIFYSDVPAFSNPSASPEPMGAPNGGGFGWSDVNVYKLGLQYQFGDIAVRGGFNYGDNPVSSEDVTVNILAPGITQRHLSLGATYGFGSMEVTGALVHAFENQVRGSSFYNNFGPGVGGTETIKMSQNSFGLSFGWRM